MAKEQAQRWESTVHGRRHRVEARGWVIRTIRWHVGDELVATRTTIRDNVSLEAEGDIGLRLEVHLALLGRARSATLYDGGDLVQERLPGVGGTVSTDGIDLDPEPGSPAARREQRLREHPWRHATIATVSALVRVLVPVLAGLVAVRFAVSLSLWSVPWPDIRLPHVTWPDLPWPAVPWPDVPDWRAPEWARWIARTVRYGWPVLLALVLAKLEVERRREQDALKAELEDPGSTSPGEA